MARKKKLFKVRGPKLRVTKKGLRVTKPTARIGGKTGLNLSSKGVSASMRTKGGTVSTRRGTSLNFGGLLKSCSGCSSIFLIGLMVIILIAACTGGREESLPDVQDETTEPTPEPTKIPLPEIELEGLMIVPGDLPSGMTAGQVRDSAPAMFNQISGAAKEFFQTFVHEGGDKGGVAVFLFDEETKVIEAYEIIVDGFGNAKPINGIGDMATITIFDFPEVFGVKTIGGDLVFTLCYAVVHFRFTTTDNPDAFIAYAERIVERIAPVVCD